MVIRNRAALMRNISLSRARRQGRARMFNAVKCASASNSSSANKVNSSSSTNKTTNKTTSSQNKQLDLYEELQDAADEVQNQAYELLKIGVSSTTKTDTTKADTTETSTTTEETKTTTDTATTEKTAEQIAAEKKEQAAKEEEKTTVVSYVKKMVDHFNTMYENLGKLSSSTNRTFQRNLKASVKAEEKKLNKLGITIGKDGSLSVQEKTLQKAELDDIKAEFCDSKGITETLRTSSKEIEKSATATLSVLNRMYGTSSTYNKYGTSNYNSYGKSGNWYSSLG